MNTDNFKTLMTSSNLLFYISSKVPKINIELRINEENKDVSGIFITYAI